jgi:hypothetical protein
MFAVERGDESPDDRGVLRESFDEKTRGSIKDMGPISRS